jgi:hypothetical protein
MQIEWSEAAGLKLGGVVKAAGVAAGAPVQRRVDGRSEPSRGQEKLSRATETHFAETLRSASTVRCVGE